MKLDFKLCQGCIAGGELFLPSDRNISLMAVMNKEQFICFEVLEANGNAERYRKYLHGLQAAHLNAHVQDPVIIMVNVGIHHAAIVLEELAILGLKYHLLRPYSPFLFQQKIFFVPSLATKKILWWRSTMSTMGQLKFVINTVCSESK